MMASTIATVQATAAERPRDGGDPAGVVLGGHILSRK